MFALTDIASSKHTQNTLRVNSTNISGTISVVRFRDKDTRQIIHYAPSLELTGYGNDENKSFDMLKFSITDYFDYLFTLTPKKRETELNNLGWKQSTLKTKEFSKLFIDINGELKNFNAVADEVEVLTLEA